ncbi:focadhesin [Ixodes scapularis]|uniref:focadhesin n=1 Tax=Ixodes scapularis TaxID=6945 RepID=UPI001A9D7678|nr:focadhesin [Ixodes scapularis]
MEDLKAMLNFDGASVQRKAVKKISERITLSVAPGQPLAADSTKKPAEFDLLLESCCHSNSVVSHDCCEALLALVVNGHLDWKFAITQLLGALYASKNNTGAAILVIGKLLQTQMQGEIQAKAKYKCPFALRSPTHPLVLVLREKPDSWRSVLEVVQLSFDEHQGWETFEMLSPLFDYVLLSPLWPLEHAALRMGLFRIIGGPKFCHQQEAFLRASLQWLPLTDAAELAQVVAILEELCPLVELHYPNLCGWCATYTLSVCLHAHQHQVTCLMLLRQVQRLCEASKECDFLTDVCIVVLSVFLTKASLPYIGRLLHICDVLLKQNAGSSLVAWVLTLPLAQLVVQPPDSGPSAGQRSRLQASAVALLKQMEAFDPEDSKKRPLLPHRFRAPLTNLGGTCELLCDAMLVAKVLYEYNQLDCERREPFIKTLGGMHRSREHPNFLIALTASAIVTSTEDAGVVGAALGVILSTISATVELGTSVFPLMLYKLGRCRAPDTILVLLKSLPKTAVHKYCIPPLYNALQALSANPVLKACCIASMAQLYAKQPQSFPLLLKALREEEEDSCYDDVLLAKAAAIGDVIKHDPSMHGVDMLGPLSLIVSKHSKYHQSAAVVLALQGIYNLCKSEVIDVKTTLAAIVPKLWRDERPQVLRSLYHLMSVVPVLSVPSIEYEKFEMETAAKLWKVVDKVNEPATTGGAYRALAAFSTSCHTLKVLPDAAKKNLKIPASKISTPMDLGRNPEDVLNYAPGYCFIDLLQSIEDPGILKDYVEFLSALLRSEVNSMPRSAYSTLHLRLRPDTKDRNLKAAPQLLCSLYEGNRHPSIQSSIAIGTLLTYEPPLQCDSAGNPTKDALINQNRFYKHLLGSLLQDVPLDANDWYRSFLVPSAWCLFMERAFRAAEESRRAELEYLRSHGKLPGTAEEVAARLGTCWLWARDMLTDAIRKSCIGRASLQGNALLALSALLVTVMEYYNGLDTASKQHASHASDHVSPTDWTNAGLEIVSACLNDKLDYRGNMFEWIFKNSTKAGSSAASLLRGCAAVSTRWILPYLHQKDPKALSILLEQMMNHLNTEQSKTTQLFVGIGLGSFVQAAAREGILETSEGTGGKGLVAYLTKNLTAACFAGEDSEPRVGDLVCLTLCLSGLSQARDEDLKNTVLKACAQFCELLHTMDSRSCSFEVHCLCTSILICSAASTLLTIENVEELFLWFEKRRQEHPQCAGTSMSLGLLVHTMVGMNHSKGEILHSSLLSHWLSVVASESQPTLSRLAAIKGLCVLLTGGRVLLMNMEEPSANTTKGLKQASELLTSLLNVSKDTGLMNCSAWILGQLHIALSGQTQSTSSVPASYAYLSDQSVLRPLTNFVSAATKSGLVNAHVFACLRALNQDFPRALPPFNWTSLLTPILKDTDDADLATLILGVAVRNGVSSLSMGSFLASCASLPVLHTLLPECVDLLVSALSTVVRVVPSSKLRPFLKLVAIRAASSSQGAEVAVKGLKEVLQSSDLQPSTTLLVCETVVELFSRLENSFRAFLGNSRSEVLADCFVLLPESAQATLLDGTKSLTLMIYLHCQLFRKGKRSIGSICNPFTAACSLPQGERADVLRMLLTCLDLESSEAGATSDVIGWFADCLMAVKETTQSPSLDVALLRFQLQLVSLFSIAFGGLYIRQNAVEQSDLASVLLLLLPRALRCLLRLPKWEGINQVVLEWLVGLVNEPIPQEFKDLLLGSVCSLRSVDQFKSPSLWARAVPHVGLC